MKLTEAQVEHIVSLETEGRRLTPAALVEDARQKNSPLHSLFNWNAKRAAELYWLDVARHIIGEVRVLVTRKQYAFKTPCYVRDTSDPKAQGYRHVEALRRDRVSSRESLIYTLETAAGHVRRAHDLALTLGLEGEIDALLEKIVGVQRLASEAA